MLQEEVRKKRIRDPHNLELKTERRLRKQEYHKAHYTMKQIPFSDQNPEEVEMLEWLAQQPVCSAYVKGLIWQDMERVKQEQNQND